ncbi:unnamed protein product [Linum trigynum]|uniref:SART-1 family protein DOT2 n=1 Tax=Linum trigynum TaxID=586398 RepID=A0AAV2FQE9_9ROSI
MDERHLESRHDRREEKADPDDSPRLVDDLGLSGVEKFNKHYGREKDRRRSSRGDEKDRDTEYRAKERDRSRKNIDDVSDEKFTNQGKEKSKDVKGKDKDQDLDRSGEELERDKDKDRKDRGKEKNRDRERETDKERSKEKTRDRDRTKDKEREKENDKLKVRVKLRENDKDGDREKGREKTKEREREVDQGKERSRDRDGSKDDLQEDPKKAKDDKILVDREHDGHSKVSSRGKVSFLDEEQQNADRSSSGGQTSTSEFRDRIMKMKEERTKKIDTGSEILSWVSNNRKLAEKRNAAKEKAKRLSKNFEEQDNIGEEGSDGEEKSHNHSHDLAGVKVLDGLDKVIEGGAVVLTLKDQSILADGDINYEVDMLENVEIGEQKRRNEAYKAAKKPKGTYDDKFNDDPMAEKKMLPQYDEPEDEGLTLDGRGNFSGEAEKKLEELRRRLQGASTSNRKEDLNSSGRISSDYYTQEEMVQFKKPKKKKSLRKKDKLDINALEAEAMSTGLGTGDLGSRSDSRRPAREEQERSEAEMRNAAYQSALAKAEEASKSLRLGQTIPSAAEEVNVMGMDEDEEDDLHKSVERARKLALKKQEKAVVGPEAIARLATNIKSSQTADKQNPATDESQEGKVVFTEIEEFVWGLQLDEDAHKADAEDVFNDEDVAAVATHEEIEDKVGALAEVHEMVKDEDTTMEDAKEVAPDEIIHEVPVGKGLSGALKLLHERGSLKESIDWGGRNMDKKKSKLVGIVDADDGKEKEKNKDKDNDRFKDLRIERRDEFGRIMTPKEAFRKISHTFHGKAPGKMKQEKRMKQYQEEQKLKQMKNSDTPSLSVERMREAQAQLRTPYLVLSGHVRPGQTSDPRSGFATVENEFPGGGLTPMLGDKKVEHFLGIKRKPEHGDDSTPKKART